MTAASKADGSRSVRKRAFHRALKRGESWAKIRENINQLGRRAAIQLYEQAMTPNPFLRMVGLYEKLKE